MHLIVAAIALSVLKESHLLMESMNENNTYRNWLVFFYYYLLDQGEPVSDALDDASIANGYVGGWTDPNNPLSQASDHIFWGSPSMPPENYEGEMKVYVGATGVILR